MASFFKKAMGVFVEFDDEQNKENSSSSSPIISSNPEISRVSISQTDVDKFEKYFDALFEKTNFPGPDYYEFHKTMETLETAIPDEKTRLSATFATLSIQGLTKNILLETATKYKQVIEQDKQNFESVLNEKLKIEVGQRQNQLLDLDKKIKSNSEQIQLLSKQISDAQILIAKLQGEATEQEEKLAKNKSGYQIACQAVLNKINSDILKIQTAI